MRPQEKIGFVLFRFFPTTKSLHFPHSKNNTVCLKMDRTKEGLILNYFTFIFLPEMSQVFLAAYHSKNKDVNISFIINTDYEQNT